MDWEGMVVRGAVTGGCKEQKLSSRSCQTRDEKVGWGEEEVV